MSDEEYFAACDYAIGPPPCQWPGCGTIVRQGNYCDEHEDAVPGEERA